MRAVVTRLVLAAIALLLVTSAAQAQQELPAGVTKEMIANPIRRIATLRTTVTVPSAAIDDGKLREKMEADARKCPVHQSLHPEIDAPIDFVYA